MVFKGDQWFALGFPMRVFPWLYKDRSTVYALIQLAFQGNHLFVHGFPLEIRVCQWLFKETISLAMNSKEICLSMGKFKRRSMFCAWFYQGDQSLSMVSKGDLSLFTVFQGDQSLFMDLQEHHQFVHVF